VGYVQRESKAEQNEIMAQAAGSLAAIGQAFGKKGNNVMRAFQRSMGGDGATSNDGKDMRKLRGRINQLVASGQAA
jgi:hypothetical protein